jgi:RHS repeat-associated protein
VEERFYLGGLEWYRRTLNGTLVEEIETLHLFDGQQRLLMVDQVIETNRPELGKRNLYRYPLSNHLCSSIVEVDENADVISYEEYHPYGTPAYQSGRNAAEVTLKRYRYTGMERDEESGLSYHTARYYAPWLARWVSADPTGIAGGANLYVYSHDSPLQLIDVDGRAPRPFDPGTNAFSTKNSSARLLSSGEVRGEFPPQGTSQRMVSWIGPQIAVPHQEQAMAGFLSGKSPTLVREAPFDIPTLSDPGRADFDYKQSQIGIGTPSQNRAMMDAFAVPVLGMSMPAVAYGIGAYAVVSGYDALLEENYDLALGRFGVGLNLLTAAESGFQYSQVRSAYSNLGPLQDRLRAAVIGDQGYLNAQLTNNLCGRGPHGGGSACDSCVSQQGCRACHRNKGAGASREGRGHLH